jgi:hypothetical protein
MNKDEHKLNLPAIRKAGELTTGKQPAKTISKFDLGKKSAIASILKSDASHVAKDILASEKGLDLVLVGDLTTSMTAYHDLLKEKFKELCSELFSMIENLRISIIFYLDHDFGLPYVTSVSPLSRDVESLYKFIDQTPVWHGGNSTDDEAMEDALNDIINLKWREIGNRSVVLFGDARPHEPEDCPKHLNYFEIVKAMYQKGIVVNSVFCGQRTSSGENLYELTKVTMGDFSNKISRLQDSHFFSLISNVTGGMVIGVDKVDDLVDIIMAAAAKDSGHLDDLEAKLKERSPNKLKLIEIARKADQRKRLGGCENIKMLQ